MDLIEQWVRLESQTVSEVEERIEAVNQLKYAMQNVKQGMEFMAADVENAVSQYESQAADNYETNRRTYYTQTVPREMVATQGPFSENPETQFVLMKIFESQQPYQFSKHNSESTLRGTWKLALSNG